MSGLCHPQPKKRKSKPNAFADILRQWESMLNAVADHPTALATVEPHRAAPSNAKARRGGTERRALPLRDQRHFPSPPGS